MKAYPVETTEAFLDGHVSALSFLGGVPQSILYDNTKLAVAKILGDGKRQRTRAFTELQSHYLFDDRFGRPGKGNDKGKVEGLVGYTRRNFLVPIPSSESFEALNVYLDRRCLERMDATAPGTLRRPSGSGWSGTWTPCCPCRHAPYDACEKQAGPGEFPVPGPVQDQRLLSAGGLRAQRRRSCGGYVDRGGRQLWLGGHRQASPLLRERRLRLSTPSITCRCWSGRPAPWTRPRRCKGWELPEDFGVLLRRLLESRMGRRGKREYVQVLRLLETFSQQEVADAAIRDAIRLGASSFDAVKHSGACAGSRDGLRRLDLDLYPYLPRVRVGTTSAKDYMSLLSGRAA